MRPRRSVTVLRHAPVPLTIEEAFRDLFSRHGLEFAFWKKYKTKDEMTVMFRTEKDSYWRVTARVETWATPEEHDDLFYDAIEKELERWILDHPTGNP